MKYFYLVLALLVSNLMAHAQSGCTLPITGPSQFCEGEVAKFWTPQPDDGMGNGVISWFITDGTDTIRNAPTIVLGFARRQATVTGLAPGPYSINSSVVRGGDTISFCSYPFEVNTFAGGTLAITESAGLFNDDAVVCVGSNILLEASGGSTYEWSTGANTPAISLNPQMVGSQDVSVTITDVNGCQGIIDTSFQVDPVPTVAISVFENSGNFPNDGTICPGASLTLSASGATSYLWSNGSTSNTISLTNITAGDLPITVEGFNNNQCSTTETASVSLIPTPAVNITLSDENGNASNGSICLGQSITLSASGGASYLWSTGEQTASIELDNLPSGVNTVSVTAFNAAGCDGFATTTIVVNSLPFTTIVPTDNSGTGNNDGIVCAGDALTLSVNQTPGYTYRWSTGSTQRSIFVPNANPSSSFYDLTLTDANGCTNVVDYNLTVNTPTVPMISVSENSATNNDGQVCTNDLVTLSATSGTAYEWSGGGETTRVIQRTVVSSGPVTYSVTVTDNNGCPASNSTVVTGLVRPIATISSAETSSTPPNDDAICTGESVRLTGNGGAGYAWSTGEQSRSITINGNTPSSTAYVVTVTSNQGCEDFADIVISVNGRPNAAISVSESSGTTVGDARVCLQENARLTASGGVNYRWSDGNETSASVNRRISNAGSNNYVVTVTSSAGCSSTANVNITGLSLPTPTITVTENSVTSPSDQTICDTESATLRANGGSAYSWSSGQNTSVITVSNLSAGTRRYDVVVTNANGCSAPASASIEVVGTPTPQISFQEDSGVPDDGRVCPGTEIILNAEGGGQFNWQAGSTSGTGPRITISGDEPGAREVTLTANDRGCTASISRNVQVYEPPVALIGQITGNRNTNRPLTVDNESVPGSGDITRWLWNFGPEDDVTPSTANSRNPPFIRYSSVGTKKVTLTTIDANECEAMDMEEFNILEENSCQITSGFSNRTQCANEDFTINLVPQIAGTTITSWNWNYPDGIVIVRDGDTGNPVLRAPEPGVYQFSVSFTDNLNPQPCTSPQVTFNVTVEGNTDPVLTLNEGNTICEFGDVDVTVSGLIPGEEYQIFLSNNDTYIVREGSVINIDLRSAGENTVRVISIDNLTSGCRNTATTGSITVVVPPNPSVVIDGSYVAPCPGGELSLSVLEPENFTAFSWRDPSGATFNTSTGVLTTIGQPGIYTVVAISRNGCEGRTTADVELATRPAVPQISGPTEVCANQFNVPYTFIAEPGAGLNWTVGEPGSIIDTIENGITVDWGQTAGTSFVGLVVEATPTIAGDQCASEPATLEVTISNEGAPDTTEIALVNQNDQDFFLIAVSESTCYQWGRTDTGPIAGETFRTLFLGDVNGGSQTILNGGYYVDTWVGDCSSEDACRNRSLFSSLPPPPLDPVADVMVAEAYPNPVFAHHQLTVSVRDATAGGEVSVTMLDLNGRVIQTARLNLDDRGAREREIDISQSTSGYYVLVITDLESGQRQQLPIIINR